MYLCDVVIIDSGFNVDLRPGDYGISIEKVQDSFVVGEDFSDKLGHGTIISTVIRKQTDKVFYIKLPEEKINEDASSLIYALNYVKNNVKCKLVNMSLGVKTGDDVLELYTICKELTQIGIVLISAFDNEGCISYPAAFDCVIGVDSKNDLQNEEIDYVEDGYVNIFAKGNLQRLRLENNHIIFVGGSSIACAYVTGMLACEANRCNGLYNSLEYLKSKARFIYQKRKKTLCSKNKYFEIANAVVFPFSKESHAFLRFSERLNFKIKGYYDIRISGKVGRKLTQYYIDADKNEVIKDISNIEWDAVDTIIIGHLDELNSILKQDYRYMLIKKAIDNNINIVSFDPLIEYEDILQSAGIKYYYPYIDSGSVEKCTFGKMFKISKPVVGIFGTSSQQGKFTLQNGILSAMEKRGYNVGSIGTEPHSLLFGIDVVFPMGYNSSVYLQNNEIVSYLNEKISKLCFYGKEIIFTASQAQTVPYYYNNVLEFSPLQSHFACGIHPDAVILCVNYHDEIQYIRNTIYALMGLTDTTVIALVMYPVTRVKEWNGVYGESRYTISDEEFRNKAYELTEKFHIPVYMLGNEEHLNMLCNNIIDFF